MGNFNCLGDSRFTILSTSDCSMKDHATALPRYLNFKVGLLDCDSLFFYYQSPFFIFS
uniref:Uncharacterized protein n=1 Tax=Oryza brachyantha TaxID=4533 RepID=J3MXL2_ORYBR